MRSSSNETLMPMSCAAFFHRPKGCASTALRRREKLRDTAPRPVGPIPVRLTRRLLAEPGRARTMPEGW